MQARIGAALVLALTIPATTGCEKTPKDRLQGRWLGEGVEHIPEAQAGKALGWVKGTALEFSGGKVTVTIPAESPRTGSFRVAKAEGDRITVSFLREEGGKDEATFRFVGENNLRWELGGGGEVVLVRAVN